MLIAYGISKGVMSSLADKASPKVFMACGLVLCAIVNVGTGFSTAFWIFAALVVLNGLFQGEWALVLLSSLLLTGSLAGSVVGLVLSGISLITSVVVLLPPIVGAAFCPTRQRALARCELYRSGLRGYRFCGNCADSR